MLHLKEDVQNCAKTLTRICHHSSDSRQYNLALCTNCDPIKLANNGSHYSTLSISLCPQDKIERQMAERFDKLKKRVKVTY